jgi:hypothetical protein
LGAVDDGHAAAADSLKQFVAPVEYVLLCWHRGIVRRKGIDGK